MIGVPERGGGTPDGQPGAPDFERKIVAAADLAAAAARLAAPRVFHDESRREIRVVERMILGLLQVNDFLELDAVADS